MKVQILLASAAFLCALHNVNSQVSCTTFCYLPNDDDTTVGSCAVVQCPACLFGVVSGYNGASALSGFMTLCMDTCPSGSPVITWTANVPTASGLNPASSIVYALTISNSDTLETSGNVTLTNYQCYPSTSSSWQLKASSFAVLASLAIITIFRSVL